MLTEHWIISTPGLSEYEENLPGWRDLLPSSQYSFQEIVDWALKYPDLARQCKYYPVGQGHKIEMGNNTVRLQPVNKGVLGVSR